MEPTHLDGNCLNAPAKGIAWQVVPFALTVFVGLFSLPSAVIVPYLVWSDVLQDPQGRLESPATIWMIVIAHSLLVGSALSLLAAAAWWQKRTGRGWLLTAAAMLTWLLSYLSSLQLT
jgi:hypothetical protein